jgi:hypothetical protein
MQDPLERPTPLRSWSAPRLASGTVCPLARAPIPVVALVRDPHLARWIRHEFVHLDAVLRLTSSLAEVAMERDREGEDDGATPEPRLFLIAIDDLASGELCAIKGLRDATWHAPVVALSCRGMPPTLRIALGIDRLLTPPFVQDLFSDILASLPQ